MLTELMNTEQEWPRPMDITTEEEEEEETLLLPRPTPDGMKGSSKQVRQ